MPTRVRTAGYQHLRHSGRVKTSKGRSASMLKHPMGVLAQGVRRPPKGGRARSSEPQGAPDAELGSAHLGATCRTSMQAPAPISFRPGACIATAPVWAPSRERLGLVRQRPSSLLERRGCYRARRAGPKIHRLEAQGCTARGRRNVVTEGRVAARVGWTGDDEERRGNVDRDAGTAG